MAMRLIIFLLFYIFLYGSGVTANDNSVAGARSAGLAGASVSLKGFWSIYNNQAGIAEYNYIAAGISYENRFLIKELSTKYAAIILPVRNGAFGLSISSFGYTLYSEKKIGLAYARKFGKYFSAALQIDYLGIRIGNEYGKKDLFTFECGIQVKLSKDITGGLHIFNPSHSKLSDQFDERLPATIKFGITYTFSKKILSVLEIEKNSLYHALFRIGIEYKITKTISLRTGIANNPFINSFGAGFRFGSLMIDVSSAYHPDLGFISHASFTYKFKSKKG